MVGISRGVSILATLGALYYGFVIVSQYWQMFNPVVCSEDEARAEGCISPLIQQHFEFDLSVYMSKRSTRSLSGLKKSNRVFYEDNLNLQSSVQKDIQLKKTYIDRMLKNETLFAHVVVKARKMDLTLYQLVPLTRRKVRKSAVMGNLMETANNITDPRLKLPISHLQQNCSIHIVDDFSSYPRAEIPSEIARSGSLHRPKSIPRGTYPPVLWINQLHNQNDHIVPPEDVLDGAPLVVSFESVSLGYFRLMHQFQGIISVVKEQGFSEKEADVFRDLATANIYVLTVTMLVAILHSLFGFFAFKNDISFWSQKKGHGGISPRNIVAQCIMQIIIFLYLVDSGITNWLILVIQGASMILEAWKVTRILKFSLSNSFPFMSISYVQASNKDSKVATETDEYDKKAMRWVFSFAVPTTVCYSVYILVYKAHKGWYSWGIESLAMSAYATGFIFMLPQLFINYKLQSTAHLPWRAMTYKALDTFVDDLFSFIISMPFLHRLAVLRDDVVFIMFLVQKYKYKTDMTRVNEFGQSQGYEAIKQKVT